MTKKPIEYKVHNGIIFGYEYSAVDFENAIKYYLEYRVKLKESLKNNEKYNLTSLKNKALDRVVDELRDKYHPD